MKIPGFDILEKVSEGHSAIFWKARQVSLDRAVTLKTLKPEFSADPEELATFRNPARFASHLKSAGIVQIYDVGEAGGDHYISMEHVEGKTVSHELHHGSTLSEAQAVKVALAVAEALRDAWAADRIILRNIKPDNILLADDGSVKIIDVGLATRVQDDGTIKDVTGGIRGTPSYLAPEQAQGSRHLDCRTDMYALGATLYHLVTGQAPFEDDDPMVTVRQQVEGFLPDPRTLAPGLSHNLAVLMARLMMKKPEHRFTDWSQLAPTLKKMAAGQRPMVKLPPGAVSTIQLQKEKRAGVSVARGVAATMKPAAAPAGVSTRAKLLVWLVLIVAWGLLAFKLLDARGVLYGYQAPAKPVTAAPAGPAPSVPAPSRPAEPVDANAELAAVADAIHADLVNGRFRQVLRVIAVKKRSPRLQALAADFDALESLVRQAAVMNDRVALGFGNRLGQAGEIRLGGEPRAIVPIAVAGESITANLVNKAQPGQPGQQVTFSLLEVDPDSRAEWMGPAETAADHAIKCLLYLQANNPREATRHAAQSGPLAPALERAVRAMGGGGE